MDDASEQRVEVCVRDASEATERAVGCAQTGAHGTVQSCQCEPMKGAACGAEDCKVHEYR